MAEKATKEECIQKCRAAAQMLNDESPEALLAKLNDPVGPFVWKDSYVFCMTLAEGIMAAHPFTPELRGKDVRKVTDVNGKMFLMEFLGKARNDGEGWTDYMWPKPGETEPSRKTTYCYSVPGTDYIMAAGTYAD